MHDKPVDPWIGGRDVIIFADVTLGIDQRHSRIMIKEILWTDAVTFGDVDDWAEIDLFGHVIAKGFLIAGQKPPIGGGQAVSRAKRGQLFRGVMTWVQADRNQVKPWVRAITGVHGAHFIDYFGTSPWASCVDVGDEEHFAIELAEPHRLTCRIDGFEVFF